MSGITLKHFITFLGCMLLIFPLALAQQEGIYSATESEKLRLEREHDLFGSQDVPPIIRIFSAEHGWRSGKIVGGEDADIADFPWQVALMQGNTQFCAGSIIHKEWILTAAHCLTGGWNPDYIRAGVTNRTDNTGQDIGCRLLYRTSQPSCCIPGESYSGSFCHGCSGGRCQLE